jgi:hypothetical protein
MRGYVLEMGTERSMRSSASYQEEGIGKIDAQQRILLAPGLPFNLDAIHLDLRAIIVRHVTQ